jgi:hypothetical protein
MMAVDQLGVETLLQPQIVVGQLRVKTLLQLQIVV